MNPCPSAHPTSTPPGSDVLAAARMLWSHRQAGTALDVLPAGLRPAGRADGYAIQALLPEIADAPVVGWKIAATSAAGQAHIGVDGPLAGRVLAGHVAPDGAMVSLFGNRMRVAEPEFAFRLGVTLAPRSRPYTVAQVLDAVDALHLAVELPNSRFADFARAGEAQLIADDACAHLFVLGAPTACEWRAIDLRTHRVLAEVRSAGGRCWTREGDGTAVLGDPRFALAWLVNELSALGCAVEAGQFVSTGTCMVPLEVVPGDRVQIDYGVLGRIALGLTT